MDAIIDPVALVNGGELRRGGVFYALPLAVPESGPLGVLRLTCQQVNLRDRYDGDRVPYEVQAVGRLSFSPPDCYLDEREAVAAALAGTRLRLAGLLRRERELVEQAVRLGIPAGAEGSAPLSF